MADVRALVTDDRVVVRAGVEELLAPEPGIDVVATVGCLDEPGSAADRLFVAPGGTDIGRVDEHIGSIFTKLGLFDDPDANRRVHAVLACLDAGNIAGPNIAGPNIAGPNIAGPA